MFAPILLQNNGKIISPDNPNNLAHLVCIPSENIQALAVNIPSRSEQIIQQSIGFAVEELIIQDIENVHLSYYPTPKNVPLPVIAVAHSQMHTWLETLADNSISTQIIIADFYLLPWQADCISVFISQDRFILRYSEHQGLAGQTSWLWPILKQYSTPTDDTTSSIIQIYTDDLSIIKKEYYESVIDDESNLTKLLIAFAHAFDTKKPVYINLLQGIYSRKPQWRQYVAPFLPLSKWALICCVFFGLNYGFWFQQQQEKIASLDQNIAQQISQLFPNKNINPNGVRTFVDAYTQALTNNLQKRESSVWRIFEKISPVLAICGNNCFIREISNRENQLVVIIETYYENTVFQSELSNFTDLETHLQVDSQSANGARLFIYTISAQYKQNNS